MIVSRLETVEVGMDEDGEPMTSCVIVAVDDAPAALKAAKARIPKSAQPALRALKKPSPKSARRRPVKPHPASRARRHRRAVANLRLSDGDQRRRSARQAEGVSGRSRRAPQLQGDRHMGASRMEGLMRRNAAEPSGTFLKKRFRSVPGNAGERRGTKFRKVPLCSSLAFIECEFQRRRPKVKDAMQQAADHCLSGSKDSVVVVGPLLRRPSDDGLYFVVATAEARRGFRCVGVNVEDDDGCDQVRLAFLAALIRPGVISHDTDDDLYMVQLCETLWPGPRIAKIRQQIEAERVAAASGVLH